jgi:hypothetical protein
VLAVLAAITETLQQAEPPAGRAPTAVLAAPLLAATAGAAALPALAVVGALAMQGPAAAITETRRLAAVVTATTEPTALVPLAVCCTSPKKQHNHSNYRIFILFYWPNIKIFA